MRRLLAALWIASLASPAPALEPSTVEVRGVAAIGADADRPARDVAFEAALVEAVLSVARPYLEPERQAEDQERLREALAGRASGFVLTYRVERQTRRPSPADPSVDELEIVLVATVDRARVRAELRDLELIRSGSDRPSVALVVRGGPGAESSEPVAALERYLMRTLERERFVVVDPALRPLSAGGGASALEIARSMGADVALDVTVTFRERQLEADLVGGVAEVVVRGLRAEDGTEIALSRFDAPGYDESRHEAFLAAIVAVRDQVADNLKRQVRQNWRALSRGGTVRVTLTDVSSFLQVEAVRSKLRSVLSARRAELLTLGPRRAELRVEVALSPGALQDRLAAVYFEGFSLEPVEVGRDRVDLRVRPTDVPAAPAVPPS